MATTTLGVKLDEATRDRLKQAAQTLDRTPHWLIKQAIFTYLEQLDRGLTPPEHSGLAAAAGEEAVETLTEQGIQVFLEFAESILPQSVLRAAITGAYRRPETEAVPMLLEQARLPKEKADATQKLAMGIAEKLRNQKSASGRQGLVQGLLQEFSLSSQEGVALMCLAEALLRIPDKATRDALIRDKISGGNWSQHLGQSTSLFVNAASWGLLITGKLVATHNEAGMNSSLKGLIGKGGEPLIRKGVDMAMRLMGEQFVTGETIAEALANAGGMESKGFRYSYDMLGEAALTEEDAKRYLASYEQAIHAIGKASHGRGIYEGPGISIKLSALHPRYSRAQYDRVMEELYPTLLGLTQLARQYDIGINIDAEEADRLEISLDLLEKLCFDPSLADWNGIGFVIQAYQKRCPSVIDYVIDLAKRSRHRLMIRLVKGAYWDSEIKRAQQEGLEGYPVYTRKPYTDVSYLACARKLLAVPEAIYPQFATHNAHSLSAIYQLAGQNYYPGQYEFQCLHGMGEPLYEQVVGKVADERCVERLAHAVQALEFVLAGLPALAGQMEDRRERVCVVRGELGVDHVARGEQPLRAGEIGDVGIDLARIDGVAGEPIDLGALDLAVPVGPLDETNHQPALACPSPSHQPVDDERGAFLVCLHDESEPVPAGELGVGERRIEQVERELEPVGFLGVDVQTDVVALGEPAQLQQAWQQLGEHAVGLGPVIARMQGAQFHRDAVAIDHAAPGVAPADGVDGVLVIGQITRGVFGRHCRFAQHVEGVTEPFLLERPHAIERFLDRAAGDEGFTQQAHGHVQPLAHQRLAAAREQAREGGGKRLFLGKGNELAGDDQAPGGGIDEDRAAAAQMLAPLAAREFVADEGIARGGVRDTQQRLGQAHERHAFAAREAEFGHQRGHPALLALTLAQGLGEFGSQTFDARQEIRRPSGLFDTGRYTIWFRRPGGERDEVAPGVRRRCGGGSEAHGVSQERGCADYKPSGWRH